MLRVQKGSILIEGLISIIIFSIGVLALVGMQSVAIKNASQAQYRNEAGSLAGQIINQMMVDQNNLSSYAGSSGGNASREAWETEVQRLLPNATATITYVDTTETPRLATVTLTWRAPDEATDVQHQYVISASLMPSEN